MSGRDIAASRRDLFVIDTFGLTEDELETRFPRVYQRLTTSVRPQREQNNRESYRDYWWIAAEPRSEIRGALDALSRFIVTPRTAKHRLFSFVPSKVLPEARVAAIALSDAFHWGILSSRIHEVWACAWGARQGVGNDLNYNVGECFDPFPFPDPVDEPLKQRIRDAAEKLDALRKQVLERHDDLTLTKLYNVLEALRAAEAGGGVLSDKDRDIAERGCVSLIRQYHDEIDAAVAEAYGWGDLLDPSWVDPSTASRSPSPFRGGTEEVILERLVALNKERAAEEARGKVRWLRPEYQAPGYVAPKTQEALPIAEPAKTAEVLEWPSKLAEQVVAVAGVVEQAGRPVDAAGVARAFKGKRAASVLPVLDALAGMGRIRKLEGERFAA